MDRFIFLTRHFWKLLKKTSSVPDLHSYNQDLEHRKQINEYQSNKTITCLILMAHIISSSACFAFAVMYLQSNPGGFTVFGWRVDRTLINTIFFLEISLVLFVLGKTVTLYHSWFWYVVCVMALDASPCWQPCFNIGLLTIVDKWDAMLIYWCHFFLVPPSLLSIAERNRRCQSQQTPRWWVSKFTGKRHQLLV